MNEIKEKLDSKGYRILACSSFNKGSAICLNDCLSELVNSGELKLNNNVKKIVDKYAFDTIAIIFKNHYEFKELPNGYIYFDNELCFPFQSYCKNCLEIENIEKQQLEVLSKWVDDLEKIN